MPGRLILINLRELILLEINQGLINAVRGAAKILI
jgi:hypothetical protein